MKTLLIAASAIALSTPALAQMEPAAPATTQSTTTTTTAPAPATPPAAASAPAPSAPATTTSQTTTTTTAATPSDPKALIASEFPTYDKDGNGTLDKTEFAAWMTALKAKTDAKPTPAAEMAKWTDGAFATADKDKSKSLTLAELQTYLTAGA
ncbi:MAG: hypothetical protein V4530_07630 [Pseudomonadota bacterium]